MHGVTQTFPVYTNVRYCTVYTNGTVSTYRIPYVDLYNYCKGKIIPVSEHHSLFK